MNIPKVLFLQARTGEVRESELKNFADKMNLPESCFEQFDLLSGVPGLELLDGVDFLLIGGSGDYCVSKGDLQSLFGTYDFLKEARNRGIPMMGVCYGAHVLTAAFGGRVVHDVDRGEIGSFLVSLTKDGIKNPLFNGVDEQFYAQFGHNDHMEDLPEGAVLLATSERSHNQIWCFPDEGVYAFQAHLELSADEFGSRITHYKDEYFRSDKEYDGIMEGLKDSPFATSILLRFMDEFVLKND